MKLEIFLNTCNYLKKTYRFYPNKLIEYCRSVYSECKATMNDKDLDVMLEEYYEHLIYEDSPEELNEVLQLREEVCNRLAKTAFWKYGKRWAKTLELLVNMEDPSSLKYYEKCIAIYERLQQEYGKDEDYEHLLADCYRHTANFCDLHWMHNKTIEYTDKALKLYWKFNQDGEKNLVVISMAYQQKGESYIALEIYEKAKECLLKSINYYRQFCDMQGTRRVLNLYMPLIVFCRRLLERIRRLESIPANKDDNNI